MILIFIGILIVVKALQYAKALFDIISSDCGSLIWVRVEQPQKACFPNTLKVFDNLMVVKLVQSTKAHSPILTMLSGITMDVIVAF